MRCPKCSGRVIHDYKSPGYVSCMNCGWLKLYSECAEVEMAKYRGTCTLCERSDLMLTKKDHLCATCYNWKIRDKKDGVPTSLFTPGPRVKVVAKSKPVATQSEKSAAYPDPEPTREQMLDEFIKATFSDPILPAPVATIHTKVTPSTNPLLPAAVECEVVLNFDGKGDLLDWLQQNEVTTDHILELLDKARNRELRAL